MTGPGRTQIAPRVLERIATQVLTEVGQTGGAARRLLGVRLGQDAAGAPPQVRAQVDGHLATMQMTISVGYPAPVRQVTRQLRDRVTTRVGELTGLELRQLDIDIARLLGPEPTPRQLQ